MNSPPWSQIARDGGLAQEHHALCRARKASWGCLPATGATTMNVEPRQMQLRKVRGAPRQSASVKRSTATV
eukprot:3234696-Lingulodinium_polyedra.AAC.1